MVGNCFEIGIYLIQVSATAKGIMYTALVISAIALFVSLSLLCSNMKDKKSDSLSRGKPVGASKTVAAAITAKFPGRHFTQSGTRLTGVCGVCVEGGGGGVPGNSTGRH